MDGMTYLNQISTKQKPQKQGFAGLPFSPKLLKFLIGAIILTVIIIVASMLLNSGDKNTKLATQIITKTENLTKTIDTYGKEVKASNLRSITATLKGVLTETQKGISDISSTAKKDKDSNNEKNKTIKEETTHIEEINGKLLNAKLNGQLDAEYLNQIVTETTLLISLEGNLLEKTKNDQLKETLSKSMTDLQNVLNQLNNYTSLAS